MFSTISQNTQTESALRSLDHPVASAPNHLLRHLLHYFISFTTSSLLTVDETSLESSAVSISFSGDLQSEYSSPAGPTQDARYATIGTISYTKNPIILNPTIIGHLQCLIVDIRRQTSPAPPPELPTPLATPPTVELDLRIPMTP